MDARPQESIAARAHQLWEERGRPAGHDLDLWLEAEAAEARPAGGAARPDKIPVPTNLDRALPFTDQLQAQDAREEAAARPGSRRAPEHFIAVLDRSHLNIYRVREAGPAARAGFDLVEFFHLPAESAPRVPTANERLPMQTERGQQLAAELAGRLSRFLQRHQGASWDYAAGPALHRAVLDRLPPPVRARLNRAVTQELVGQSPAELEAHFTP